MLRTTKGCSLRLRRSRTTAWVLRGRKQSSPAGYLGRSEIAAPGVCAIYDDWARATDHAESPKRSVPGRRTARKGVLTMSTQTDQRSISVKQGEPQGQSSQRREMTRSSPRTGYLQRRGEYPFGFGPYEFFRANPFSLLRRMTEEMDRMFQETGLEREGSTGTGWSPAIDVSQREG